MRRLLPVAAAACLLLPAVGVACLWDYDTLKMERARFPDTLELITGKFLRHSPEFYRWRIADRLKRLESDPNNVRLLDDLAAAYDKTGEHDKAIETAERTERIKPGRYETAANLGTFLFHAGRLNDGLPHIDRALKINPDAHFGREKYQKLLVEYVLKQRAGRAVKLPLADRTLHPGADPDRPRPGDAKVENRFRDFLGSVEPDSPSHDETAAAVKGVLGMMKFGDHKSPILLEALGTLLLSRQYDAQFNGKHLACRAFLKASYEAADGPIRTEYRSMAMDALRMQTDGPHSHRQITLEEVEAEFRTELAEAQEWYSELREKELTWIRDGKNPEVEFDKLYDAEPQLSGSASDAARSAIRVVGLAVVGAGAALVLGWLAVARLRRTRTTARQPNP